MPTFGPTNKQGCTGCSSQIVRIFSCQSRPSNTLNKILFPKFQIKCATSIEGWVIIMNQADFVPLCTTHCTVYEETMVRLPFELSTFTLVCQEADDTALEKKIKNKASVCEQKNEILRHCEQTRPLAWLPASFKVKVNTNIRIKEAVVKKGELCGKIDRGYQDSVFCLFCNCYCIIQIFSI